MSVAISSDNRRVITNNGKVRLWDATKTPEPIRVYTFRDKALTARFTADGRHIAVGCQDNRLAMLDVGTGVSNALPEARDDDNLDTPAPINAEQELAATRDIYSQQTTVDCAHIASINSSAKNNDAVLRVDTFEPGPDWLGTLDEDQLKLSLPISSRADLAQLRNALPLADHFRVRSYQRILAAKRDDHTDPFMAERYATVAFTPSGTKVATVYKNRLRIWNSRTGVEFPQVFPSMTVISISENAKYVVVSPTGPSEPESVEFLVLEIARRKVIGRLEAPPYGQDEGGTMTGGPVISPDAKYVASQSQNLDGASVVFLWNCATGKVIATLSGHASTVCYIAFSPDSRRIVTGSTDGTLRVWETATGRPLLKLEYKCPNYNVWTNRIAFSPDGSLLAAVQYDGTVKMWSGSSVSADAAGESSARKPVVSREYHLDSVNPMGSGE